MTEGEFNCTVSTWSPDGKKIAFHCGLQGKANNIYVLHFDQPKK
ncbi:MAG: hypothetical protein ACREEM_33210 [Blastocatellia bacterium]